MTFPEGRRAARRSERALQDHRGDYHGGEEPFGLDLDSHSTLLPTVRRTHLIRHWTWNRTARIARGMKCMSGRGPDPIAPRRERPRAPG